MPTAFGARAPDPAPGWGTSPRWWQQSWRVGGVMHAGNSDEPRSPNMTRTRIAGTASLLALAVALAPVGHASAAPPRLIGTPTLRYVISRNTDNGRFVTIGATARF